MVDQSGGPSINSPTTTEAAAAIKTAAAPTSLPTFARGCWFGLARSTTASSALFKNSAVQTVLMATNRTAQSRVGNFSMYAIRMTRMVTTA